MCDLAGAERPEKAGLERKNGMQAYIDHLCKKDVDPSNSCAIINYELHCLATEVFQATEHIN